MEFKIITDLSVLPQVIETNAEELKAWLSEKLTQYNEIVVTPETIKAAKDDKSKLTKLRAALEERRKEVKRQCMAPYEDFERKYKELLALIDEPIGKIDTQIKALDEQEQKQKYVRLKAFFDNCMASSLGVPVDVNFDRILNPKWKNKTMKADALEHEIYETLCRIRDEVQELHEYYASSPHFTAIMDCYMQGYDKSCALAYAAALIQQEARARAEQVPPNAPAGQRSADVHDIPTPQPVYELEPPAKEPSAPAQHLLTGMFRVTGTKEQIIMLRDWMRHNKIQFEIVKEK